MVDERTPCAQAHACRENVNYALTRRTTLTITMSIQNYETGSTAFDKKYCVNLMIILD